MAMTTSTPTSVEFPSGLPLAVAGIYNDGTPSMSFGMAFSRIVSQPVTITAIRWFAVAGVTVRPRLWSPEGGILATGGAVLCVSGWNTLPLSVPYTVPLGTVVAGVYQTGASTYGALSKAYPIVGAELMATAGRYSMLGDGLSNAPDTMNSTWYGIDVVYTVPVEQVEPPVVPPISPAAIFGNGVYAEASRQMAAVILIDQLQVLNVGPPVTVGINVTRALTPVGTAIAGLVQTTTLANAVESRVDAVYSIKVAQGTALAAGQAVKVLFCRMEPDLAGRVLLVDKISRNGMAMLRKAVASDFEQVNQEGKGGLS